MDIPILEKVKTVAKIFSLENVSDPNVLYNQYSKDIIAHNDNPFLPYEKEQLNALNLDEWKAKKSFERAYYLYQQISNSKDQKTVRLYKLNEVSDSMKSTVVEMKNKVRNNFYSFKTKEEVSSYIKGLVRPGFFVYTLIQTALTQTQERLEAAIIKSMPKTKARENAINPIFQDLLKIITKNAEGIFFNGKKEQLQATAEIYYPNVSGSENIHTWGTNLAWMLAHIRKKNNFLVCSDIIKNKYRRGYIEEKIPSAFAREICTALKAGYTLCKDNNEITLQSIGLTSKNLLNCDSTGALGNGINPSFDEIEKIYNYLENNCKWNVDFQCHFNIDLDGLHFVQGARPKPLQLSQRKPIEARIDFPFVPIVPINFKIFSSTKMATVPSIIIKGQLLPLQYGGFGFVLRYKASNSPTVSTLYGKATTTEDLVARIGLATSFILDSNERKEKLSLKISMEKDGGSSLQQSLLPKELSIREENLSNNKGSTSLKLKI